MQQGDCELVVSSDFVNRLVNAYLYPLELKLSDSLHKSVNEKHEEGTASGEKSDYDEPLEGEVIEGLTDDVITPSRPQQSEEAPDTSRRKVAIESLSITVTSAPTITLGNPVMATDIALTINARLKVELRLLGKWRKFNFNVRNAELTEQRALLHLFAENGRIYCRPEFLQLKITPALRILKWHYRFTADITRQVNRHLQQQPPFDVISLPALGLPHSSDTHLQVDSIHFAPHPMGLLLRVNFLLGELVETSS